MKFGTLWTVALGLVGAGLCTAAEPVPFSWGHSNHEQLKDLKYFIGEWRHVGTIMGEPYEADAKAEWAMNRNLIKETANIRNKGDKQDFMGLVGWDAPTKSIRMWGFWMNGIRIAGTRSKTQDGWKSKFTVSHPNGENTEVEGVLTIVDKNTYKYDDGGVIFTSTRKKKSATTGSTSEQGGIPARARRALSFFLGKWESETYQNGEEIGEDNDSRTWLPGKHAILMKTVGTENGAQLHSSGISGWDAKGKQIVESWHSSDGLFATIRYPIQGMTKDMWSGDFTVTFGDGSRYDGECSLHVQKKGWTWVARWVEDGKQMERKSVTRRVKD